MATLSDRILGVLGEGVTLDDDELAARLGVIRQQVNQVCRRLAVEGRIVRGTGGTGKTVNRQAGSAPPPVMEPIRPTPTPGALLTEDEVKAAVRDYLEADGYRVAVRWGRERGVDIDAKKPGSRLLIEAKGEAKLQPQQVNYFLGAIGELVQRMMDADAEYGLALPDNRQYRGLVDRIPAIAKSRLRLRSFFVSRTEDGLDVRKT